MLDRVAEVLRGLVTDEEDRRWLKIGLGFAAVLCVMALIGYLSSLQSDAESDPYTPAQYARAHEDDAAKLCQGLVNDRLGIVDFRDVHVLTTGVSYKVEGRADVPGRSYQFGCTGSWEQDGDGGQVRVTLDELS